MQINDSYITAAKNQLKEGVPITQTENAFSRNEGIFFSRSLQKNEIIKVLNLLKFKKLFIFCDPSLDIPLFVTTL